MRSTATSVSMKIIESDLASFHPPALLVHPRDAVPHFFAVGPHADDLGAREFRGGSVLLLRKKRLHLDLNLLVLRQIQRLIGHEHLAVVSRLDGHRLTSPQFYASRRLLRRAQRLDPPDQRVVFLARADGDADLVG